MYWEGPTYHIGLNPFEFRASVRTVSPLQWLMRWRSLNPFEFRASVRTFSRRHTGWRTTCLNPFEFRASVRTIECQKILAEAAVSIPLNSGHQFERPAHANAVLIVCLNPFEFRASVRTKEHGQQCHDFDVSIPLNSGHQFEQIPAILLTSAGESQSL